MADIVVSSAVDTFMASANQAAMRTNLGAITNANLANSSVTIGSTTVALGATAATIEGVTVVAVNLTKSERNALDSPAAGTIIYQTDNTPGIRVYNGTHWVKFTEANDD